MSLKEIHETVVEWIDPITDSGKKWCTDLFNKKINGCFFPNQKNETEKYYECTQRSKKSKIFAKISEDHRISDELYHFKKCENELLDILNNSGKINELEKESEGELFFLKPELHVLNFIPYLLTFWAVARIYIFPIISMSIPFFVFVLPYFILKFIMKVPITMEMYIHVLKKLIMNNDTGAGIHGDGLFPKKSTIVSLGSYVCTFVSVVVQGYWSFKHLYSINVILERKAYVLLQLVNSYKNICELMKTHGIEIPTPKWFGDQNDLRQIVASAILYPVYFKIPLLTIAEIDCWIAIGKKIRRKEACVTQWLYKSSNNLEANTHVDADAHLDLKGIYDPSCSPVKRIPFNFEIGLDKKHYLLTGPNKGGKSTTLRAITSSIVLAHTFGCSLGDSAKMTPIDNISICLRPDDLPGQKSRFEREIEFAWKCLKKKGSQLILIDEMFHSTNPPDAEQASQYYTNKLWKKKGAISVISTHLFNFVENAPDCIGRICCPATFDSKQNIRFTYKVEAGICKVSSVKTLIDALEK